MTLSFCIGTMLAAISSSLIATIFPFTILSGGIYSLDSFVIGVLGRLDNPIGSLFRGLSPGGDRKDYSGDLCPIVGYAH